MIAKYYCGAIELIDYTPAEDVPVGTVVALGDLFGVALEDLPANRPASLAVSGVFNVKKAANNAMTRGATVAYDVSETRVDDVLTVGKRFGTVYAAPVTAGTEVYVRLNDRGGTQAAVVAALTDSTGGTGNSTLAAVGVTNTGDRSADINNNFADVAAKIAEILTALKAAGLMANS